MKKYTKSLEEHKLELKKTYPKGLIVKNKINLIINKKSGMIKSVDVSEDSLTTDEKFIYDTIFFDDLTLDERKLLGGVDANILRSFVFYFPDGDIRFKRYTLKVTPLNSRLYINNLDAYDYEYIENKGNEIYVEVSLTDDEGNQFPVDKIHHIGLKNMVDKGKEDLSDMKFNDERVFKKYLDKIDELPTTFKVNINDYNETNIIRVKIKFHKTDRDENTVFVGIILRK